MYADRSSFISDGRTCKMAVVFSALKVFCFIFVTLYIKKPSFVTANSVCYLFHGEEVFDSKDSYVTSSLWQYKQERSFFVRPNHVLNILLLIAGDGELCTGPSIKLGRRPWCKKVPRN